VLEALIRLHSPFHRTPKKGSASKTSYRPLKDYTCLVELSLGFYCLISVALYLGFTNVIVSPFLLLYAAGFLFVGLISIIHYKLPHTVGLYLTSLFR